MTWSALQDIKRYRPRDKRDATSADFAERLTICGECPRRLINRCQNAGTLVSVAARPAKATCPIGLWPDGQSERPQNQVPETKPDTATAVSTAEPVDQRQDPPRNIAIISCHFNPCGYTRPIENYRRFVDGLGSVAERLHTVELAFDDEPFQLEHDTDPARHFAYRVSSQRGCMWQKERLINLGIAQLSDNIDAVAWIDADLLFLNPRWWDELAEQLQRFPVVQLCGRVADTDDQGRLGPTRPGIGMVTRTSAMHGQHGRPGGAWAAWRWVVDDIGLYDAHVLGGGDSILSNAWLGEVSRSPSYAGLGTDYLRRQTSIHTERVAGRIGYVTGDAVHLYHGTRDRRRYSDRYQILRDGQFDPETDLIDDPTEPLQWSDHALNRKPDMVEAVARYFVDRQEDSP